MDALVARKRTLHFVDVVAGYIEAHPAVPVTGLISGVVPDGFPALHHAALDLASERGIVDRIKLRDFKSSPAGPAQTCRWDLRSSALRANLD